MYQKRREGDYICYHCGYLNKARQNMQKHVETHLDGPGHTCKYCSRTFKTTNSLNTHISVKHRQEKEKERMFSSFAKSVPQRFLLKQLSHHVNLSESYDHH